MLHTVFIEIKDVHISNASGWLRRPIKISYAILQSNLDSSERGAFFSSRDKEHTVASAQTAKQQQKKCKHTPQGCTAASNTHSLHTFFNYQAGENSGEGLSVWSSVSISSVNNTSLGQS